MRARSAFLMIAIVAAGTLSAYAQDEDFDEPDDLSQFIDEEIEGDEHEYETTESVNRGPQGSQADELNRRFQVEFTQHLITSLDTECASELQSLLSLSQSGKELPNPLFSTECQAAVDSEAKAFQPIFMERVKAEYGDMPGMGFNNEGEGEGERAGEGASNPNPNAGKPASKPADSAFGTIAAVLLFVTVASVGIGAWAYSRTAALAKGVKPKKDSKKADKKRA